MMKKTEKKYNVAYKGSVQAGIDISKIEVTLDEDNKIIDIQLPEVEVDEPYVDVGSLEFMFLRINMIRKQSHRKLTKQQ